MGQIVFYQKELKMTMTN